MKNLLIRSLSLVLCVVSMISLLPVAAYAEAPEEIPEFETEPCVEITPWGGESVRSEVSYAYTEADRFFTMEFGKYYSNKLRDISCFDAHYYDFTLDKTAKIVIKSTILVKDDAEWEFSILKRGYEQAYESIEVEVLEPPTAWTLGRYKYTWEYLLSPGDYTFELWKDSAQRLEYSFTVNRTYVKARKPEAPDVDATVFTSSGKPNLSWYAVDYAEKYYVYRASSKSGDYSKIKTVTGTSYTDTSAKAGKKYYYKVKAVNEEGQTSSYSNVVSARCIIARPTLNVSNVSSSGKIKLSWKALSGAKKYTIYRADSASGNYTKIKITTETSYTDTSAEKNHTYYYQIQAIASSSSANSARSAVVSGIRKLPRPTVTAKTISGTGKIKLSWKAIDSAVGYNVYRATSSGGTYSLLGTTASTSYVDDSAAAGKKYYYKVSAISENGNTDSANSSAKSGLCKLARPEVSITRHNNGDPQLTWSAIEGCAKYRVYRATSKKGEYKLVKTTSNTVFNDTSAKAGKTYYYKVKAIYSNSSYNSVSSSVVSIKAK